MAASQNIELQHELRNIPLEQLYLDPNNYRFIDESLYKPVSIEQTFDKDVQTRTQKLILGEREENVRDLIESLKKSGWIPVDNIQVREIEKKRFVVVEGNRRVAALKWLKGQNDSSGYDLGSLNKEIFAKVPVHLYREADEVHHLVLMGLKHISGNKKWPAINQARFLKELMGKGMTADDACKSIGISKRELNLSLNTLALCDLYIASDYGDQFRSDRYNLFREVMNKSELRSWLGWDYVRYTCGNSHNLNRMFGWFSAEEHGAVIQDDDLDESEAAETAVRRDPLIRTGTDIRELVKIIKDEGALKSFERSRDLRAAVQKSEGHLSEMVEGAISNIKNQSRVLFEMVEKLKPQEMEDIGRLGERLQRLPVLRGQAAANFMDRRELPCWNDLPEQHFTSLFIQQYRSISGLELKNLRRLNLIAGFNNAGKTSLLEAIYLLANQSDTTALLELVVWRSKRPKLDTKWLYDLIPTSAHIAGHYDRRQRDKASLVVEKRNDLQPTGNQAGFLGSVSLKASYSGDVQETMTQLYSSRDRHTTGKIARILCRASFSSPFILQDASLISRLYEKSVEQNTKDRLVHFLRDSLPMPNLEDIELVNKEGRLLVKDGDLERPLDLTDCGDGLQRIFHIGLMFAGAANGVVLLDEFENAIHFRLLIPFAQLLLELAKIFNVQVFLTTHSKEAIEACVSDDAMATDISFYALRREQNGSSSAVCLSGPELVEMFENSGIDPRGRQ